MIAGHSGAATVPHLTIAQLEYLVAAVDHETWADGAAAIGVSPSAMSQGMAELQRRLGVELFVREGRRMTPRPGAQFVVDYARRVLADTRDLARWAQQSRSGQFGRVALGMIDAAAIHYCGDALAKFRSTHTDVELHLRVAPSAELIRGLREGELDLVVAVARADMSDAEFDLTHLTDESLFVYAPAGQQRRPPAAWGPWVTFPADSHTRRIIARALRELGAPFEVMAESSQPDVLREMVHLGVGWAVLPQLEAEREPHPLPAARRTPVATRTLSVIHRSARPLDPTATELAKALMNAI